MLIGSLRVSDGIACVVSESVYRCRFVVSHFSICAMMSKSIILFTILSVTTAQISSDCSNIRASLSTAAYESSASACIAAVGLRPGFYLANGFNIRNATTCTFEACIRVIEIFHQVLELKAQCGPTSVRRGFGIGMEDTVRKWRGICSSSTNSQGTSTTTSSTATEDSTSTASANEESSSANEESPSANEESPSQDEEEDKNLESGDGTLEKIDLDDDIGDQNTAAGRSEIGILILVGAVMALYQ